MGHLGRVLNQVKGGQLQVAYGLTEVHESMTQEHMSDTESVDDDSSGEATRSMTEQAALVAEGDRVRDDSGMKLLEGWELRRHARYGTCDLRKWMEATTLEAR
eukprot:2420828-Amphidinium_carterae.1